MHKNHQGYLYTQILLSYIKKWTIDTLNNIDASQKYYAERKKSDIKKYKLGIFIMKLSIMNIPGNNQIVL